MSILLHVVVVLLNTWYQSKVPRNHPFVFVRARRTIEKGRGKEDTEPPSVESERRRRNHIHGKRELLQGHTGSRRRRSDRDAWRPSLQLQKREAQRATFFVFR